MRTIKLLTAGYFILVIINLSSAQDFITVKDGEFYVGDTPYYFMGANFWYGMNLGTDEAKKARLLRELDQLAAMGVNNLRIMGLTEGPDDEPWRVVPSIQPGPGEFSRDLFEGLDFLLDEMKKRNMYAVVCLGNFWPWSGGFAQYIQWVEGGEIPYPPPAEEGDWNRYQRHTARFYSLKDAAEIYNKAVLKVINRVNTYNGLNYTEDPTIMAWELANEPRGIDNVKQYRKWIKRTARLIKKADPNHLVTVGSEGATSSSFAGTDLEKDHRYRHIDYTTIHIWIQNWGWYDPGRPEETYEKALDKARHYLMEHVDIAEELGKPIVLEEFGIARDNNDHDPQAPVTWRDRYYRDMFETVLDQAKSGRMSGLNFWAWGGEGRPRKPHSIWEPGDDLIGDPPHEFQGWYSVYDKDESTNRIIREFAGKFNKL